MKDVMTFTIGAGAWNDLAHFARSRWRQANYGDAPLVQILSDRDRAGYSELKHPSWMKLHIFEFTDLDEVVIFDADVLALQPSLREFVETARAGKFAIYAAEEPPNRAVDIECQLYQIPRERYFNCGLLYLTRAALPALKWARERHPHYGSWMEQTALNAAVQRLGIPAGVAPSRFNHLIPPRAIDTAEIVATGAANVHFSGWKDPGTILAAMRAVVEEMTNGK